MSKPSRALRFVLAAVALLLIGFAVAGLVRIRDGEVGVVVRDDGGEPRLLEPGWRWVLPGTRPPARLPRTPRAWNATVEPRTPEGAALVVEVEGEFGVLAGREREWIARAGGAPFFDALGVVIAEDLGRAFAGPLPVSALADEAKLPELVEHARTSLERSGVRATNLRMRLPVERNPVLASLRNREFRELARPTGAKVLVIGWDGADWLLIRPLLDAGRMPNLARLIARGSAVELRSEHPLLSPLLWTTIATGKPVLEHGIADFLVQDAATGAKVPISSASRKVHALWTILPAFGLEVDTVAWWASWPAEETSGTMVSDRVAYQLFAVQDASDAGKVYPPEAWGKVREHIVEPEQVPCELMRRFVDLGCEELERRWRDLPPEKRQEDRVNHLRKILATTRTYHAITLDLLETQADLTLAYYEATDTVGHLFARYLPPRLPGVTGEEVATYGRAVPETYVWLDHLLGELLAAADPATRVLLISDHGFYVGEARPRTDTKDFGAGAPNWHRLNGILVAAGPGVERRGWDGATIFDVAPTVLDWLGLPVPRDLPGRVLPVEREPRQLATYEKLHRTRAARDIVADRAADAERIRELVALGYLSPAALRDTAAAPESGSPATAPVAAAPATPTASAEAGGAIALVTEAYNLGRIHQRRGEYDEAEKQFRIATERAPTWGQGWASLAQVASLRGDHARAFRTLEQGLRSSGDMPPSAVTGLVDEAKDAGLLAEAGRALKWLESTTYRQQSAFHAAWGLYFESVGDAERALGAYRNALGVDPMDQLAIERTIALLRGRGDVEEAEALFDRTFERARGTMGAMNHLGLVSLREQMPERAERIFRTLLESDPGNAGLLSNLSAALARQGKHEEAIRVMSQALAREPANAQNHHNLGALLAERGRVAEALSEFEAAERHGLRNSRLYVAIAKMRFRLGDRAGAEAALRQSLAVDPGHAESRELLEVLRSQS